MTGPIIGTAATDVACNISAAGSSDAMVERALSNMLISF